MTNIPAIIASIKPAAWWTPERYRAELAAVKPQEARDDWNASIRWDDAVRAAVARHRTQEGPQTGDLFGGER